METRFPSPSYSRTIPGWDLSLSSIVVSTCDPREHVYSGFAPAVKRSLEISFHSLKQRDLIEVSIPRQKHGTVLKSRSGYPDVVGRDRCALLPKKRNEVSVTPRDSLLDRDESHPSLPEKKAELLLIFRSFSSTRKSGVKLTENNSRDKNLIGALE